MSFLSSPRRRRRLIKLAVVLVIAVPLVLLAVFDSTPGDQGAATGPEVAPPKAQRQVPFRKADRRAVRTVLREFIATAVARHDTARAWQLASAGMRSGLTRAEWSRGELPVVPYPAAETKSTGGWDSVEYSYPRSVGLTVFLNPRRGSGLGPMTADVELVKGRDGRWRIDYWMPTVYHGSAAGGLTKAKPKTKPKHAAAPAKRATPSTRTTAAPQLGPPKPSRAWWLVPMAVVGLIVLTPIALGLGVWYRNRRAARHYARAR